MKAAKLNIKRIAKNPLRLIVVALAATVFFSARAHAITSPYTMSSKYILMDIDKKILYCEGDSEFLYKNMRFQSKTMRVDLKNNVMIAEGNVIVTAIGISAGVAAAAPQAAVPDAPEKSGAEEADARLKQEIQNRETSGVQSYEGDQLRFDIERMNGHRIFFPII